MLRRQRQMKCVGEAAASFGERGVGAGRGKSVGWGGGGMGESWVEAGNRDHVSVAPKIFCQREFLIADGDATEILFRFL